MIIVYETKFVNQFNDIWDYISQDSLPRANSFKFQLKKKIENLPYMPYKFKQSIYFNHENIRDFVYKGYVIPYKIDTNKETITIIGINKYKRDL